MNVNRCERCGCFFTSESHVCPNCTKKDNFDKIALKNYLEQTEEMPSVYDMCMQTGISEKNMIRFLQLDEFKSYEQKKEQTNGNISINL